MVEPAAGTWAMSASYNRWSGMAIRALWFRGIMVGAIGRNHARQAARNPVVEARGGHGTGTDPQRLGRTLARLFRRADHHSRGAIADRANFKEPQRVAHHRRGEHFLDRELLAEARPWVVHRVLVGLYRDLGQLLRL